MKKLLLLFIPIVFIFSSCYKDNTPPVSISFLSQTQTFYHTDSIAEPGEVSVEYYIYNNTFHYIDHCEVEFIVYYSDNTYEITEPDVTKGIRDHQRNDIIILTNKAFDYVDVYSVLIDGSGCRYNIIE
jgi:hypothetical protein